MTGLQHETTRSGYSKEQRKKSAVQCRNEKTYCSDSTALNKKRSQKKKENMATYEKKNSDRLSNFSREI